MPTRSRSDEGWNYTVNRYNPTRPPPPSSPFGQWLTRMLATPAPPGYGQTWYGPAATYPGLFGGVGATGMASYPNVMGTPYGGVNPYLSGQSAYPYSTPTYAPQLSPEWAKLWKSRLTYEPALRADLVAANAPPSGEWNPWSSFGSGSQTGWYSANPATGYVNYEAGSIAEAQKNIAGSPEGTRLIWGSPYAAGASAAFNAGRSYLGGASPAPVIGGSRKMSWAGQTKAKKNWNPNKFAYRKMSAPNPLPMAATGPAGVGLVYGNANWGRP